MNTHFGPIKIIHGENRSIFPFCRTIFIDDDIKAIIDPGAGVATLNELKTHVSIDMVFNTHFHFDHISGNYLFDTAKIYMTEPEAACYRDRRAIAPLIGMQEVYGDEFVKGWLARIADPSTEQSPYSPQNNHQWWLSTARLDGAYRWGEVFDFGKVKMEVIGAPGHSAGFSCMHFPAQGVIYVADLDLTSFGPWYAGSDGDIDLFIQSSKKIEDIDAEFFITAHEEGILTKEEFQKGMTRFLNVIEKRDHKIISLLSEPHSLEEIVDKGLIYGKKYLVDAWVYMWETITIKKHLQRLVRAGIVSLIGNRYRVL